MAKETTRKLLFGKNMEISVRCVAADIGEELSDAIAPDKQEIPRGIKQVKLRTDVGADGPGEWQSLPNNIDLYEMMAEHERLKAELKQKTTENAVLKRRLNAYEKVEEGS